MQKLPKIQHSRVSLFASITDQPLRSSTRTIALIGLLFGTITTASAQIAPTTGSTPTTTGRPGQATSSGSSGTIQIPAGVNIPAGTRLPNGAVVGPNNTIQTGGQTPGRNTPTGRTAQQGANTNPNQRAGQPGTATQAAPGATTGRTQTGDGQNGQAQLDANGQPIEGDVPLNANEEANEKNVGELTGPEAQKAQERANTRRKLFGYEIFNNPALATTFQPNLNMATPVSYVLGTGDQLDVNIYGYSQDAIKQTITPEGNIYLPSGIGPVHVSGLSIEAAKSRIQERLSKIYVGLKNSTYGPKNTYLEVTLGNIRSIRVSVLGEAIKPGTYSISSLSSMMNVIYASGGPSDLGSFRNVQLIRGSRVIASIDLYDLLLTGVLRNNVRLQDNDNIRIPAFISHVEIQGATRRNNIFEMLPGETVDKLLFYSGGFTANAYKSRIKITRLTNRELKVIDVLTEQYKSFAMQDGDVAVVEEVLDRYENQVSIVGAVYRPGIYSLDQNKTLKDLVSSAEGPRGEALMGRVNVQRTREDMTTENITIDLTKVLNGTDPDLTLQREDLVTVNSKFDLAEGGDILIQGEVNRPGPIGYVSNMTLEDAFVKVGGLRESAAASQVEIVRRKKDADPTSTSGQIAQVFKFSVDRNLELANESKFYLLPYDQVIVRRSPNYQVQTYAQVEGEVIIPGVYPIQTKDQKLSDLVTLAGGLTPQAYVRGATLVRRVKLSPEELAQRQRSVSELADDNRKTAVQIEEVVNDKPESIGINLERILERPGSSEDILVQENDVLRIPKKLETVRIQGEVLLPTTVKYRNNQTFQDYISQAGGFSERAQRKRSFIVYANGSVDKTRRFMFFNVYPRVEPGAEVIIPVQRSNPLTPQQLIGTVSGIASGLLGLISTLLAISVISRR